ncbi:hypothetical protein GGR52DRAFT_581942 [Hypoxylon sp. FL1284]|nr:hypothetical protein GGR52DRAFT_581942 [Hypoxylon sp. FL1284]
MVAESRNVPTRSNVLATIFHWVTLAELILLPGTFSSRDRIGMLQRAATGTAMRHAIRNMPLLYVAGGACLLGGLGISWLWWTLRHNYVWLVSRIFFPGVLNAMIAFLSTLVNVYTAQSGDWSLTALVASSLAATYAVLNVVSIVVYQLWPVRRLKQLPVFDML